MKNILVLIANGFEEIEAVCAIDVMRRASINVTVAAVGTDSLLLNGANQIKIQANDFLQNISINSFDGIVLPGGMANVQTLSTNELAQQTIIEMFNLKKLVAAICAAPIALDSAGIITDSFTCYPGCEQSIKHGNYTEQTVVLKNNILTSRGPGTALCFGLAIVEYLLGKNHRDALQKGMLASYC